MVELMETFKRQEKLHRKYAFRILLDVMAYLEAQPSMVTIDVPPEAKFTVCGDIHGQFYDLMNVFSLNGLPSESNPYVSLSEPGIPPLCLTLTVMTPNREFLFIFIKIANFQLRELVPVHIHSNVS